MKDSKTLVEQPQSRKAQPGRPAPRGRVLRVKEGYNPNSSSVGSAIPLYLGFAAGAGALTVLILNLQSAIGDLLRAKRQAAGAQQDAPEPDEAAAADRGEAEPEQEQEDEPEKEDDEAPPSEPEAAADAEDDEAPPSEPEAAADAEDDEAPPSEPEADDDAEDEPE